MALTFFRSAWEMESRLLRPFRLMPSAGLTILTALSTASLRIARWLPECPRRRPTIPDRLPRRAPTGHRAQRRGRPSAIRRQERHLRTRLQTATSGTASLTVLVPIVNGVLPVFGALRLGAGVNP